ncbi:hypothetical protein FB451DRAFT_1372382 [Mycena latifolia]|nr:hypothetical protein FB451DRAFT_1378639 [Mycena latifolia]KAJ7458261.1 hypothetical protein FB451DRAFT_1372382 [Mycena latifolia]
MAEERTMRAARSAAEDPCGLRAGIGMLRLGCLCLRRDEHCPAVPRPRPPTAAAAVSRLRLGWASCAGCRPYGYGDTAAACSTPITVSLALRADASATIMAWAGGHEVEVHGLVDGGAGSCAGWSTARWGCGSSGQARLRGLWSLGNHRLGECDRHRHLLWLVGERAGVAAALSLAGARTTSGSGAGTGSGGGAIRRTRRDAPQQKVREQEIFSLRLRHVVEAVSGRDAAGYRATSTEWGALQSGQKCRSGRDSMLVDGIEDIVGKMCQGGIRTVMM